MKINPKYLIYHDLIGLQAHAKSKEKSTKEFRKIGIIVDDTKNMLITAINNQEKKFVKKNYIFRILIPNENKDEKNYMVEFDGIKIVGRPENRLRSLKKKRRFKK